MSQWQGRGKDGTGADTFVFNGVGGSLLITRHAQAGVQLWRMVGGVKELLSTGFRSVEAAKDYVERMPA